jgi:hypothetical protein
MVEAISLGPIEEPLQNLSVVNSILQFILIIINLIQLIIEIIKKFKSHAFYCKAPHGVS